MHSIAKAALAQSANASLPVQVFAAVVLGAAVLRLLMRLGGARQGDVTAAAAKADREPEPLRNFTLEQLKAFTGVNAKGEDDEDVPIYVALRGEVFDVSQARHAYGKEGNYHIFAGHDASVSLARHSLDASDLNKMTWEELSHGERDTLDGWIQQFRDYKGYPMVGRVVTAPLPDPLPVYTKEQLAAGTGEGPIPDGAAAAPMLVAVAGKVFDVSYGGAPHYGKGCPYNLFVGRDASRALAKMSFDAENLDNPSIADLSLAEVGVMNDWAARFEKKGYRVVGTYPTC
ncbi:hypothetical protein JKP88DRAFT_333370 [Tribonema minus]|uniref:Cytochrome b5 heme-binding domain-containing protein n=1 Tax=Tribonema minus TaxID=303371 RepID=A0A836C9I0_9STRA|nr:hypothetical protein JKP88DRAFT_333370 [Tribonema minus]